MIELILAVCLLGTLVASVVLMGRIRILSAGLRDTADDLKAKVDVLVGVASELVEDVNNDVDKFEHLLDSANRVADSMGSASRLAYSAVATPIVRAKALRAGAAKLAGVFKAQASSKKGVRK